MTMKRLAILALALMPTFTTAQQTDLVVRLGKAPCSTFANANKNAALYTRDTWLAWDALVEGATLNGKNRTQILTGFAEICRNAPETPVRRALRQVVSGK